MIVDQDADIHQLGKFPHGGIQRFFRVVGGHHDGYAFAVNHASFLNLLTRCLNNNASAAPFVCPILRRLIKNNAGVLLALTPHKHSTMLPRIHTPCETARHSVVSRDIHSICIREIRL